MLSEASDGVKKESEKASEEIIRKNAKAEEDITGKIKEIEAQIKRLKDGPFSETVVEQVMSLKQDIFWCEKEKEELQVKTEEELHEVLS